MFLQITLDPLQMVLIITLVLIYLIFLLYEFLKRKERLEYIAYLAATIPFAYMWFIGVDYLASTFWLLVMWTIALARDLVLSVIAKDGGRKNRDYANAIILYAVGVGFYFLYAAIMPNLNQDLKTRPGTQNLGDLSIIWLPILDEANPFLNPFRLMLTIDVFMMIIPVILEVNAAQTRVPVWANILLASGMAIPTLYIVYIWILATEVLFVLGFLFGVLYFVLFLFLTRGKH
ncbi:hypothetical protein GF325_03460 [Candidatus Bathyarchaeota archaeon]|nr:hypothetical protein [Candidatus Bathyarchaeota archaeon]